MTQHIDMCFLNVFFMDVVLLGLKLLLELRGELATREGNVAF